MTIYAYCQASTLCVVSGFLLVRLCALAHHLEVCASVMGRTKRACHLYLILCASDAVITWTPVTVFFPLGKKKTNKQIKKTTTTKKNALHVHPDIHECRYDNIMNLVYRARPILSLAGSWGRGVYAPPPTDAPPPTSGERENWSSSIDYNEP